MRLTSLTINQTPEFCKRNRAPRLRATIAEADLLKLLK